MDVAYARKGDTSLAYTVLGDGPVDIVFGAGLASHLDLIWGDPNAYAWFRRLAGAGRVILFDKPGTGLSDPLVAEPTVEDRVGDFLAVMNAAGSARAVVIGLSEAGPAAAQLAATHPDRVEALVLLSTYARSTVAPDYFPEEEAYWEDELWPPLWRAAEHWGDGEFIRWLSPAFGRNPVYSRLAPSVERASASPGMVRRMVPSIRRYDVRHHLAQVRAPSLVVGRTAERIPIECSRHLAEHLPDARLHELPGDEHICFFGGDDIADVILRFLDPPATARTRSERALLTLVYTDIVGSTSAATELGDERWRSVLARHDEITVDETGKHGGRVIKMLGDGALLAFERPARAVECAIAVRTRVAELGVALRASVHAGECDLVGEDVGGITAHIGSRLLGEARGDDIIVSGTVRDLTLGSGMPLTSRGSVELRDLPGRWEVLAVADPNDPNSAEPHGPGRDRARRTTGAGDSMTGVDRTLVAFTRRAPGVTRALLGALGSRRSR